MPQGLLNPLTQKLYLQAICFTSNTTSSFKSYSQVAYNVDVVDKSTKICILIH